MAYAFCSNLALNSLVLFSGQVSLYLYIYIYSLLLLYALEFQCAFVVHARVYREALFVTSREWRVYGVVGARLYMLWIPIGIGRHVRNFPLLFARLAADLNFLTKLDDARSTKSNRCFSVDSRWIGIWMWF